MIKNQKVDKKKLTKSEVNAKWILNRAHAHDYDSGGIFSMISGSQGSAKTSVMLSFVDYTMLHYPDEKIFWSSGYNAPLQFLKLKEGSYDIFVKDGINITFHDRRNKLQKLELDVTRFKDFDDLYRKARPGRCTCPFFGNRMEWMPFLSYLRSTGEWSHVFIDELSEIAPAFTAGELFHTIGDFAINLKEVRKCMINFHANSQSLPDIDHRCRSKIMLRVFLPGAMATKNSRITQEAIDNLELDPMHGNEAYVEFSGRFGKTRFKNIYKPNIMSWEARVNAK